MRYIDLEHQFFGRQDIVKLLKKRISDLKEGFRQNVAILGNPFIGKTAFLKNFVFNIDDDSVTPIYLELDRDKDKSYVYHKFFGSLLYHYLKSNNSSIEEDEDFLIEKAQETIPQTVQVIKKIKADISIGKYKDSFLGLLSLPDIYINETGKCCVLIFDEFQNLEEILGEHVFQDLGKKIMTQKKCFYIFASSYKTVAERILSEKLSLLFGNFEIVSLGAFDLKTSQEFIEHHLQDVLAGAQLRHFLTDFTGGHPLYLNLICKELVNLSAVYKQNEIYMPLLSQAVENTIFNRWGVISRHFELIVLDLCQGKDNRVVSSLLISLANGKNKIDDIIADVAFSKLKVRSKIKDLLEKSILVKNGQHYYFQDKLFKYWVRYVYQKRLHDVDLSQEKQKKEFKEEFARSMDAIRISAGQDFSARIVDLLHCFDDESFDLNGRKYRLPVFEEVTSFKLKNDNGTFLDVIKAIGNNETWLIALKKENVGEGDIQTALSYAKQLGVRPDRCVLVALTDIEDTTRLKALQEKFWIWNEGELNTLLTIFDKPYIIR